MWAVAAAVLLVAGVIIGISVAGGGDDTAESSGFESQTTTGDPAAVDEVPTETSPTVVTLAPVDTTATIATTPPVTLVGDLGLGIPISQPPCDGSYITLIGAGVAPASYVADVGTQLERYPGSNYMLTRGLCSSLRQQMPDGSSLYVIYYGPYATSQEACNARAFGPSDAYVKRLDNSSDPTTSVGC